MFVTPVDDLKVGNTVLVLENHSEVDRVRVVRIKKRKGFSPVVVVESLKTPGVGENIGFSHEAEGWKFLHQDPMTGGLCYSERHTYQLQLV